MNPQSQPLVAVILPTDTFETIAPVLERLRRLHDPQRLEVILVSPQTDGMEGNTARETAFHSVVALPIDSLTPLPAARAAGVMAATAPFVFLGETHSYLWPDALALLFAPLLAGTADVVVPGFVNGNPARVFSWASFIMSYGRWNANLDGAIDVECPPYDFLVRRDALVGFGNTLADLLADGNALGHAFRTRGLRTQFVPEARLDHVNADSPGPCMHEHFLQGVSIGKRRCVDWSLPHRLAFIAGFWLVPPLLFARSWRGIRTVIAEHRLPRLTLPVLFWLLLAKAWGEVTGCLGLARADHPRLQTHYEIRRLDHALPCEPR